MPSSSDRKRVELPTWLYAQLVEEAAERGRTVASVAAELIVKGMQGRRSVTPQEMQRALDTEAAAPSPERDTAERWFGAQ